MNLTKVFPACTSVLRVYSTSFAGVNYGNTLRLFSSSQIKYLKKISEKTEEKNTTIEGVALESPRSGKVIEFTASTDKCPLCPERLGMHIDYTDVLIIHQFLQPDGQVLPKKVTGLCDKAHSKLFKLALQAQEAGLLPDHQPDLEPGNEHVLPKSNYKWKKYNTYFEN